MNNEKIKVLTKVVYLFKRFCVPWKTMTTQQLDCRSYLCNVLSPPLANSCEITLPSLTLHKMEDKFLLYRPSPSCHFHTPVKTTSEWKEIEISQKIFDSEH